MWPWRQTRNASKYIKIKTLKRSLKHGQSRCHLKYAHVVFSRHCICLCFGTELTCPSIGTFYPQGWILEVLPFQRVNEFRMVGKNRWRMTNDESPSADRDICLDAASQGCLCWDRVEIVKPWNLRREVASHLSFAHNITCHLHGGNIKSLSHKLRIVWQANHIPWHPQASEVGAIRVEPWLKNIDFLFPDMHNMWMQPSNKGDIGL